MLGEGNGLAGDEPSGQPAAPPSVDELSLEERVAALEAGRSWSDKIAIHGVLAGACQGESASGPQDADSIDRGAVAFQPEISITPTEQDEIVFEFGFPAGEGLNGVSQMLIVPWAANLEGDVKNINGRDRDYLLQAWYKHTFHVGEDHTVGVTGGIIDATGYLDQNAYGNDEYTQFMNPALVNGPNGFAPSYDIGGAMEWALGNIYVNGVVMNIGENDSGVNYNFYGGELGYRLETDLGEGTYRLIYEGGQNAFLDPTGTILEDRNIVLLSFDQQLGETVGAWIRFGWGDDDAAVDAKNLYSGGIDIAGDLWGRGEDNIGIGAAFFDGGNTGIDRVTVGELYYRFVMNAWLAVTADLQYQDNTFENAAAGEDIDAWTYGLRAVVAF
jgi:porin